MARSPVGFVCGEGDPGLCGLRGTGTGPLQWNLNGQNVATRERHPANYHGQKPTLREKDRGGEKKNRATVVAEAEWL